MIAQCDSIVAYHIVWTTYGTWLPGDGRGWIKKGSWVVQPPEPELERQARQKMVEPAVYLTPEQRHIVEQTVRDHCAIRKWTFHAVNARSNHVHAIVHGDRDPDDIRDQLKAWCSRKLSDAARLTRQVAHKAGRKHWFTEGGDLEFIRDDDHLNNAIRYVLEGQ